MRSLNYVFETCIFHQNVWKNSLEKFKIVFKEKHIYLFKQIKIAINPAIIVSNRITVNHSSICCTERKSRMLLVTCGFTRIVVAQSSKEKSWNWYAEIDAYCEYFILDYETETRDIWQNKNSVIAYPTLTHFEYTNKKNKKIKKYENTKIRRVIVAV